jgi:hypothetical protein
MPISVFIIRPNSYKKHFAAVFSSSPSFTQDYTDRQREDGVFEDSIKALQILNFVGYVKDWTGLLLNLVYNFAGAFLPSSQMVLKNNIKHN